MYVCSSRAWDLDVEKRYGLLGVVWLKAEVSHTNMVTGPEIQMAVKQCI